MAAFFFVAFIVLELLGFTLLRWRLASIRSEASSGESSTGPRVAGKGVRRRADTQGIIEFTSLLTLGIALTCLMFGILLLVPRPAAFAIPMSENPFYFLAITLIGVALTFASYAVTIVVAAILAIVRTIAQFIEAAIAGISRSIQRSWTRASTKPQRVSRGDVGVVDDWLDGP